MLQGKKLDGAQKDPQSRTESEENSIGLSGPNPDNELLQKSHSQDMVEQELEPLDPAGSGMHIQRPLRCSDNNPLPEEPKPRKSTVPSPAAQYAKDNILQNYYREGLAEVKLAPRNPNN
jgi:hypothetical protein